MGIDKETREKILYYSSMGYSVRVIANAFGIDEKIVFDIISRNEIKRIFKQES